MHNETSNVEMMSEKDGLTDQSDNKTRNLVITPNVLNLSKQESGTTRRHISSKLLDLTERCGTTHVPNEVDKDSLLQNN